jgi:alkaline phosphatase D|tara:strand:- start:12849 stop:13847 length:999 start_codon:yes stop_codon:yes gene_type:complete
MKKKLSLVTLFVSSILANFTTAENYKIAFGSCLDQENPQPIWNSIYKEDIDSFVFLGDNVYGDIPSGKLNKMHEAYKLQAEMIPSWLFKKNVEMIWDDHDFGENDGGSSYPLKQEAQKLYLDFWEIPNVDIRRQRDGIYVNKIIYIDNFIINLILLDTRFFRSDLKKTKGIKPVYLKNEELNATILGDDQWSWLVEVMKIKSDLTIVATSIQLLATEHRFEKWSNFPSDHLKLKKLLKSQSRPIVVISGDRHQGAIYNDQNIYEITSSSLNKTISSIFRRPKEVDKYMLGDMFSGENYGLITINTVEKIIDLEIKDINGDRVLHKKLGLKKG